MSDTNLNINMCLIIQIAKFPICQHQLRATCTLLLSLELIQALALSCPSPPTASIAVTQSIQYICWMHYIVSLSHSG